MIDPLYDLDRQIRSIVRECFGSSTDSTDLAIRRSQHADYQADVALALAKVLKISAREIATKIASHLNPGNYLLQAEVSGPGFINLTCSPDYLAAQLEQMGSDELLGIDRASPAERVVIDYSSPNLAKEMHVGHLRSTIIGDCLVRVHQFFGRTVIPQNHIGDWGTPFGMLIEEMLDEGAAEGQNDTISELSAFYRAARLKFDQDPGFADRARQRVVLLQAGDKHTLELWQRLIKITVRHLDALYRRLGVKLEAASLAGESRYNDELEDVVRELQEKHIVTDSGGAVCIFLPGFEGRDGNPLPLIVRKQDGGFGYAATDLAAMRYRVYKLHATRILYVVGAPQIQHFAMIFAAARLAGWAAENVRLEHVVFGSVLGQDGKVLKTRAGESVSLSALLDEAIARAKAIVDTRSPTLDEMERTRIAEVVGIGAVKYADLVNDRVKDYVFNWERLLAFEGNTAPYLMYAHARICSILRKMSAEECQSESSAQKKIRITAAPERKLALELLALPSALHAVSESSHPHYLCQRLFQIATAFSAFYDSCPVLNAQGETRASRLALCKLTARVLAQGLDLLGIGAPASM